MTMSPIPPTTIVRPCLADSTMPPSSSTIARMGNQTLSRLEQVERGHDLLDRGPRDQLHRGVDGRDLVGQRHPLGRQPLLEQGGHVPEVEHNGIALDAEAAGLVPPQHGEDLRMSLLVDRHPQLPKVGTGDEVVDVLPQDRLRGLWHLLGHGGVDLPGHGLLDGRVVSQRRDGVEVGLLVSDLPYERVGRDSGGSKQTPENNEDGAKCGPHRAHPST